ncbi:hypothetical protein [Streptomyces purpureus]|uniref:Uncharacterized protein n=1 Tax=Streptomyces purpureus TaxID=1951 RepID=A0A918GWD5_9ACTN|nr:hypothetical protein [Streptomyces purpureus]GGT14437.1 hypothetical protein GCM10014713_03920 [Streptomyces purpureus]
MDQHPPVIVYPTSETGGRRVRVDGAILGLAHSVADVVDLLAGVGLELSPDDVVTSRLIEWRGGGPGVWAESPS